MRAMVRAVAVWIWVVGCTPLSIHPTYHENQLISVPALDGVWRDSASGDEMMLTEYDSISYVMGVAEGDNAGHTGTTHLTLRFARREAITFVDFVPSEHYEIPEPEPLTPTLEQGFLGWHYLPLHGFSLVDIDRDRIAFRTLDADTLTRILERTPRAIAHAISDDRAVLTASTEQVQSFLIRATLQRGNAATSVYKRVPSHATCEESPGEMLALSREVFDNQLLDKFGVQLRRTVDVVLVTARVQSTSTHLVTEGLMSSGDSTPSPDLRMTLSQATPLVILSDRRTDRRLELRWRGLTPAGDVLVHTVSCYETFPSSPTAREKLPSPVPKTQAEDDSGGTRLRFSWTRVPGATAYEVQRWGSIGEPNAYVDVNDRFVVHDTSFFQPRETTSLRWRVRAYAPGVGFGTRSATQVFSWRAP